MFNFKFEKVLGYRRQVEKTRQQEFAQSRKQWAEEKKKLEQDYESWKQCMDEWRLMQADSVSLAQVDLYQKYMLRLRRQITAQAQRVKESIQDVDSKRAVLLNARKETRMMEKLRENALEEYNREASKRELRFMDEVASVQHVYKGRRH